MKTIIHFIKFSLLSALITITTLFPGKIIINWQSYKVEVSLVVATLALSVMLVIYWTIHNIALRISGLVVSITNKGKVTKLLDAVTELIISIIHQETKIASRKIDNIRKFLKEGHPFLTWMEGIYKATCGEIEQANLLFYGLSTNSKYGFLGNYALYKVRIYNHQYDSALKLLEKWLEKKPKDIFLLEQIILLSVKEQAYDIALKYAERLPDNEYTQQTKSVLFFLLSKSANNTEQELELLENSHKLDNSFVPAILEYSRLLIESDHGRKALKILWKGWELSGYYECILDIYGIEHADAEHRLKIAKKASDLVSDCWGIHYVLGKAYFDNHAWVMAQEHLTRAQKILNTAEITNLLKATQIHVTDSLNQEIKIFDTREPYWECRVCNTIAAVWSPICPRCGKFNCLRWFDQAEHGLANKLLMHRNPLNDI